MTGGLLVAWGRYREALRTNPLRSVHASRDAPDVKELLTADKDRLERIERVHVCRYAVGVPSVSRATVRVLDVSRMSVCLTPVREE